MNLVPTPELLTTCNFQIIVDTIPMYLSIYSNPIVYLFSADITEDQINVFLQEKYKNSEYSDITTDSDLILFDFPYEYIDNILYCECQQYTINSENNTIVEFLD